VAQHVLALKKAQACGLKAGPHAWAIIFFSFLSVVHSFYNNNKKKKTDDVPKVPT
jgi:hypothetical protein